MNLIEENERKNKLLKNYKNKADRYTPSLTNKQWLIFAFIADIGWLLNLIFVITYFSLYGIYSDIKVLYVYNVCELIAVALIQVGYLCVIYLSFIGEKTQQTRLQKNIAFGLPTFASFAAVFFGIVQTGCSVAFSTLGLIYIILAAFGALLCFIGCYVIFRSFMKIIIK